MVILDCPHSRLRPRPPAASSWLGSLPPSLTLQSDFTDEKLRTWKKSQLLLNKLPPERSVVLSGFSKTLLDLVVR